MEMQIKKRNETLSCISEEFIARVEWLHDTTKMSPDFQLPITRRNKLKLDIVQQPASGMVRRMEMLKGRQTLVVVRHRCSSPK